MKLLKAILTAALMFGAVISPAQGAGAPPPACAPGTYMSPFDDTVCIPTPPGTYTDSSLAQHLEPIECGAGTYQPDYGQTQCIPADIGYAASGPAARNQYKCSRGTYSDVIGLAQCLPAPTGNYVDTMGANQPTSCFLTTPVNTVPLPNMPTGADSLTDCFNYVNDTSISPVSGETYSAEIPIVFYSLFELAMPVTVTLVETSTLDQIEIATSLSWTEREGRMAYLNLPLSWVNGTGFEACVNSCSSNGAPVTSIPDGTYDIDIDLYTTGFMPTHFGFNGIIVDDTRTIEPAMYIQMHPFSSLSDTLRIVPMLPEAPSSNSVRLVFTNASTFQAATKSRVFVLQNVAQQMPDIDLKLDGTGVGQSSFVASESGDALTSGLWWVWVIYQDALGNPAASYSWGSPLLIARSCPVGKYSTNGLEACEDVAAGYTNTYLDPTAYDYALGRFNLSPCPMGTYQPVRGAVTGQCELAEPGHFVAVEGSAIQFPCALGMYQPQAGETSCLVAPAGTYVDIQGTALPVDCEEGTYQPDPQSRYCLIASAGHYTNGVRPTTQFACPAGTYQPNPQSGSCISATAGYYVLEEAQLVQTSCGPGSYQPLAGQSFCHRSDANFYVARSAATAQTRCPANTFSAIGSDSRSDCKPKPCSVKAAKYATAKCLAFAAGKTIPTGAKVKLKISKAQKKFCKVSAGKVKGVKRGSCSVTLTVKPKKGKTVKIVTKLQVT